MRPQDIKSYLSVCITFAISLTTLCLRLSVCQLALISFVPSCIGVCLTVFHCGTSGVAGCVHQCGLHVPQDENSGWILCGQGQLCAGREREQQVNKSIEYNLKC